MSSDLSEDIKRYPFIRLVLALIAGIVLTLIFNIPSLVGAILLGVSLIAFVILHFTNRFSHNLLTGLTINTVLFAVGIFLTAYQAENAKTNLSDLKGGLLIGEVSTDPKASDKTTTLEIDILAVKSNDSWSVADGKTLLYIENDKNSSLLKPGDKIVFTPQLSEIENKGNPEEFDFKKYLSYNLILSSDYIKSDEWERLDGENSVGLQNRFLRFRIFLINKLSELGLSNDELAVVSALALGYQDSLSDEVRHSYSSSGAMHILAVSGLHVGIIYGIIIFLLSFLKNEKLKVFKVILTILLIWGYAFLTGLSPSVSRAALMFSIMALGNLQKNKAGSLNAIAASAFILLVINPYNITNIGFQLSYIAVIGIILLYEPIYRIFEVKNKFLEKVWSLTAVSVAAQVATAPLCLFYFHQFSNYFLITNYLLIPVSTVAIWLVIIVFAFSGIGFLGSFFAKILGWVIKTMNFMTAGIESLPFSVTENVSINIPQMLLLYAAIIAFAVFFFSSKKYSHLFMGLLAVISFFTFSLVKTIESGNQKYFIVYNINKTTAINIIDGTDNIMFANLDSVSTENIEFSAKNNWLKKGLDKEKYVNLSSGGESILSNISKIDNRSIFFKKKFIAYDGLRIFVLDDSFRPLICDESFEKIKLDFIILSNNPDLKLEEIALYFDFKKIIVDSSNSMKSIEKWLTQNVEAKYNMHVVKSDGAYIQKL